METFSGKNLAEKMLYHALNRIFRLLHSYATRISLPIGTNDKPLAAIGKFSNAISKLMIGKTLATNGEEITNAMIGNDVLAIYW